MHTKLSLILGILLSLIALTGCSFGMDSDSFNSDGDTTDGNADDGDEIDGDAKEGDVIDGEESDGDAKEGDAIDTEESDGEVKEDDAIDVEESDGDEKEGNVIDGDESDGEMADGNEELCWSHISYLCYDDDVWWTDSCGIREEKKQECGAGGCSGAKCTTASFSCTDDVCNDSLTGFEWQQNPTGGKKNWEDAKSHCQNLSLSGSGWHLPNISELRSLVRNCGPIETDGACGVRDACTPCGVSDVCLSYIPCREQNLCNPDSCPDDGGPTGCYWPEELSGACSWHWSSSLVVDYGNFAWSIWFDSGYIYHHGFNVEAYVRCVR